MPKPIVNNRINYQNAYSRIIQHDTFISQGVRQGDSPTFASLRLTGNATIEGNLYVEGNTSIFNTNVIEFEDNIVLLNSKETSSGVTLLQSGIEIERGSSENFRIVYNESSSRVEVGLVSNLQPITIRESIPLSNGIMIWNNNTKRIESSNEIVIPINLSSSVNSTSSTTGTLIINGGVGINKDIYVDGTLYMRGNTHGNFTTLYTDSINNHFNITSPEDIYLTPNLRINIPFDKYLSFGNSGQSIIANSLTNALSITSSGDIFLTPSINKRIHIPNQIPLTFSTNTEQIYTDSSNNIIIASSQDVYLYPNNGNANGKKVFIPVDTPLAFSNQNQYITSNITNDLIIAANNNILLNPGATLDVKIPIDAGIRFGAGYQRITSNSNNDLIVYSEGDLFLSPQSGSQINIPNGIPLTFASSNQYIIGDTNGNITISPTNKLIITAPIDFTNTTNAINGSTGSIYTNGGIGVTKDIYGTNSLIIKSNSSGLVQFKNNSNTDLFKINAANIGGNVSIVTGDGLSSNASLDITSLNSLNAQSLIQLKANYDSTNGYMIGRGTSTFNNGRSLTLNLPDYSSYSGIGNRSKLAITSNDCSTELFSVESETGNVYSIGLVNFTNTKDSTSASIGTVVINGGIGISKSLVTTGKIVHSVNSSNAYELQDENQNVLFNNDSIAQKVTINEKLEINGQNYNLFKITDTSNEVVNIDTIDKKYTSLLQHHITNTIESSDTSTGSLIVDGGVGIKKQLHVEGNSTFSNGINLNNTKITNLMDPTSSQDAATKAYVDLVKQGLFVKDSVTVATITGIDINNNIIVGGIIDNYVLVLDDRVLVKNQINAIENGIYVVTNSNPVRAIDCPVGESAAGFFSFVKTGDINASLGWICNSPIGQDIVGTHDLTFTQFTGLGQVTPGFGLIKNFNEISINVDNISLEATPVTGELRIKDTALSTGLTGGSGTPLSTTSDQSHVTKLGTIDTGRWQGSVIGVAYGGTGTTNFDFGSILIGDNNSIAGDPRLYYDKVLGRLGIGTNTPLTDVEIRNYANATLFINSDSEANNQNAKPEIRLSYNGTFNNAYIGLTRVFNEYANDIYNDALVISNDQTTINSRIQLATNQVARVNIMSNGFVGINTSNPSVRLEVHGDMNVTDDTKFFSTRPSTSITEGAVVISGGLSIGCPTNSIDVGDGGGLTVEGGASVGGDLFVGGSINSFYASSNTFSYLTITATDEAINLTSGALVSFGGITIQCTTDAISKTDGGSLLVAGGASIVASMYVGNTIYGLSDAYIGNLYFSSTPSDNFIQPPDVDRNVNSFLPIHFTAYANTDANILTIADTGIVLNDTHYLQLGGTLQNPDGYNLQYIPSNFNIIPNNTNSNYNINFGTIGNYTNINIYGNNSSQIRWNSSKSNLLMTTLSIQLNKLDSSGSIVLTTPDNNSESFIKASGGNMILNIGSGSTGGQLITKLSNNAGDSTITFTPSNITCSTLSLTNNIYTDFNGPVALNDRVEYSGNALHQTINNTTGNSLWIYMGKINTLGDESGYCEIDFNNGVNTLNNNISGLKLVVAINNTSCIASHLHYGNLMFNSTQKPIGYIYNDSINDYHLFVKLPPNSQTNINVTAQRNTKFLLLSEGTSTTPSGIFSGYINTWFVEYTTLQESTLSYTTGDLTVEGETCKICDNLPIVGYNNKNTNASRDIGTLYQRYQEDNDMGSGDIVDDNTTPAQFIDSIPNQSLIPDLYQIKFSNLASSIDNYYVNWWIKIVSGTNTNQVRQIIAYNGAQRVATLSSEFTGQNPNTGATVNFYSNSYVVNYYDETNDTFALSYTHSKPINGSIEVNDNADLRIRGLYSTDTTVSTNSSSGSIYLLGGISIDNTNDAVSASYGGTITTAGGVGIRKDLRVGNNIGIGTNGFTTEESIHIRKSTATTRFEHDTDSYSYIDFMENGTNTRYGLLFDSNINQLCLTNSTNAETPINANKALIINNLGYVGINTTTNIVSPLALSANNFISTNSTSGYLGIVGGSTNINGNTIGSRIMLYANSQDTDISRGSINLYAGNVTNGNISIFTKNDIERLRIDHEGYVSIFSTHISDNSTMGSVMIAGGVSINATENATSITRGGALTVNGGAAIKKDVYIGGNIYIDGTFTAYDAVTEPPINSYNPLNCTFIEYFSNTLSVNGNFANLVFGFTVTPSNASENCEIEFDLPSRITPLNKRFEVISTCSGYVDDTNVIPLMNVLSYGETDTTRLKVKFQSVSTSTHYLQVTVAYLTI